MKKLFAVQLDGLSYPVLQTALETGLMPFTASLLTKGYRAHELFCGLPSTTPCSLLQVLYGSKELVNFQCYIRQTRKVFNPQYIDTVVWMEEEVRKKYPDALARDTTTICTIFSGKKQRGVSVGTLASGPAWKQQSVSRILIHFLHPYRFFLILIKVFTLSLLEVRAGKQAPKLIQATRAAKKSIAGRLFEELLAGEIGSYYSTQAIRDGDPVIYVNFAGYDNLSHHYGSHSKPSMAYLSLADLYVKQVYTQASREGYEFVILSDHGQATSIPIKEKYGRNLDDHIRTFYPGKTVYENHGMGEQLPESVDMMVLSSGSFATVYDTRADHALERDELEKSYPDFARNMSEIDGVSFLVLKQNGVPVVVKNGKDFPLTESASHEYFPSLPDRIRKRCVEEIALLLASPYTADCYIYSDVLSQQEIVAFEHQWGTHGGIGNEQTRSLFISRLPVDPETIPNLAGLHDVLRSFVYGA